MGWRILTRMNGSYKLHLTPWRVNTGVAGAYPEVHVLIPDRACRDVHRQRKLTRVNMKLSYDGIPSEPTE